MIIKKNRTAVSGGDGFFANGYMYEVLKESDVTMEEYYTTAIGETINDKICMHDEETQNDCYRGFYSMFECVYAASPDASFNNSTVGDFISESKDFLFGDEECVYAVYGDENKCVGLYEATFIFIVGDRVFGSGYINNAFH